MTRKMKDSGIEWIGKIPEDWEVKRIQWGLTEIIKKNNPIKAENILSLTKDKGVIPYEDKGNLGNKSKTNLADYKLAYRNSIVMNSMNVIIGSVGLSDYFGCVSPVYYVFKAEKDNDIRFFNYIFQMPVFQSILKKYANGILEIRLRVSSNDVLKRNIPFPNYKEQIKISNYLDKKTKQIEDIKNKISKEIENLENYKKSMITEAVTKGLDKNVEMKDSGIEWIGEIPKHWEIIRLKYGLTEKMKYGASEEGVEFSETLPRYIRITDIDQNGNLKSTGKQSLPENKSVGYILEDNTVLFARSGATVGKTFLYKKEYGRSAYAGYLIAAKTNNIILLGVWLYYFTFSDAYYNWTRQMFSQSTIQNINAEKYSNMPLPITGISNQLKIIDYLNKKTKIIDDSIAIKQKQLETLEEYKKSLIYEYVTGKKEVKDGEES